MNKKAFFICPVRGADQTKVSKIVANLESDGWDVYYPPLDTDQNDSTGYRICIDNLAAIKNAEMIFIYWDGKSQGCLFDAGMAFALDKPITIIGIPMLDSGKSFQAMFTEWENRRINSGMYCTSGNLWSDNVE